MKISQREARRLKKRVEELERIREQERERWVRDYPGGVHMGSLPREKDWLWGSLNAAQLLGHPIVVTTQENGELRFYAVP